MFGGDERSIAPTPRRLAEARRAGYAPQSHQLTAAISVFAGLAALCVLGDDLWREMTEFLQEAWSAPAVRMDEGDAFERMAGPIQRVAVLLAIVLGTPVIGALVGAGLQTGFRVGLQLPRPGWEVVNPRAGLRRIGSGFSLGSIGGLTVGLLAACLLTGWMVSRSGAALAGGDTDASTVAFGVLVSTLGLMLGVGFVLLGVGDWVLRRRRFWRSLRMTMAEAREEGRAVKSPRRSRTRRQNRVSVLVDGRSAESLHVDSNALTAAKPLLSSDPQIP